MANQKILNILDRPKLFERFVRGLSRRVTVIEAPAGYGKSTLLSTWRRQLDAQGNVLTTFIVSFGDAGTAKLEHMLSNLPKNVAVRDYEAIGPAVCVFIDDFHEAMPREIEMVQNLIGQEPLGKIHVVLSTRDTLDFPLARFRLANQVSDFGLDDLKFSRQETTQLLTGFLPASLIDECFEHAEGWVAALQLMWQSYKGEDQLNLGQSLLSGRKPEIAEYLNEQFFQQMTPAEQSFLLETAHLKSVNGDIANHIRNKEDGWMVLRSLSDSHSLVFETFNSEENWFRYHQLLQDFLTSKQKVLGEAQLSELHKRSAEWYFCNNELFNAVRHAAKAGCYELAEKYLIDSGGVQVGVKDGAPALAACLDIFPISQINSSPRLNVARSYIMLKNARIAEAALHISEIRQMANSADQALNQDLIIVEAFLRIYQDRHLTDAQLNSLEHTAKTTPAQNQLLRGLMFNFLCILYQQSGRLKEARLVGEEAMLLYSDLQTKHLQFFMHINLSIIDLDQGKFEHAYAHRRAARDLQNTHFRFDLGLKAIADIFYTEIAFESDDSASLLELLSHALDHVDRSEGWSEIFLAGYETCFILVLQHSGYPAVIDTIEQAEAMIARRGLPRFARQMKILQLDISVRAGNENEARRLAPLVQAMISEEPNEQKIRWRGSVLAKLALARFELAYGDATVALKMSDDVAGYCAQNGLKRYELRSTILGFVAARQLEDKSTAAIHLVAALSLVGSDLYIGAFLRDADDFAEAARWTIRENGISNYVQDQVSLLSTILWKIRGRFDDGPSVFAELLTQKEAVVLKSLSAGNANKVIARELGLTEPTIKYHLKNIYIKLGVNSRKMATELAIKYGI